MKEFSGFSHSRIKTLHISLKNFHFGVHDIERSGLKSFIEDKHPLGLSEPTDRKELFLARAITKTQTMLIGE